MKSSSCREIEEMIGRDPEQLSEAARLRLEQHLGECSDCRQDLALSRATQDLFTASSLSLSDTARERALARALDRAKAGQVHSTHEHPRKLIYMTVLASAAAAALALWVGRDEPPMAAKPAVSAPAVQPAVESHSENSQAWIDAQAPQTMQLAHAKVDVTQGTRLRFDGTSNVLTLAQGRVDLNVDPTAGKPFWVHTQTFRVQVLGTQFSVTPDRVSVREGHVQVTDHQGKVLARDLAAGATFSMTPAAEPEEHASAQRDEPAAQPVARSAARDASSILSQARKALSMGQTGNASQLLDALEHTRMARPQQAEASTLRAEVFLLEQKPANALKQYEELSRRFRDLPAGENAAFAAAQLAPRAAPAREKSLLASYLARYPRGRFVDEATARLKKLPAH